MSAFRSKVRIVDWCLCISAAATNTAPRVRSGVIAASLMMVILGVAAGPVAAQSTSAASSTASVSAEAGMDAPAAVRPLASWRYYLGARKGITREGGEYHHYVEFNTNRCGDVQIVTAPLPSSRWGFVNGSNCRRYRVGYNWPSNWWDPYPAWMWSIRVWE